MTPTRAATDPPLSDPHRAAAADRPPGNPQGLAFERVFSREGVDPYAAVEWETRTAEVKDEKGRVVFRQEGVSVPAAWSQQATNVVAGKYFYGELGTASREYSVRQIVHRVARTVAGWGWKGGVFATADDALVFHDELVALVLGQYGSFNSPVWFNVGLFQEYGVEGTSANWVWDAAEWEAVRVRTAYERPQASACFIQSVEDNMDSIMALATSEANLFKHGSGTGSDLSTLRSSREKLAGGGKPSGPVSFLRVYDAVASVIKSGGKTRRAAKLNSLHMRHPDIVEFIECKPAEERKARALIAAGYEADYNGEAYRSVAFQNANLSVRATDDFLKLVAANGDWRTVAVTTGQAVETHRAGDLMDKVAEGTWLCGDPGVQYHDTINRWHTCPNAGAVNASNPCGEYNFLDDTPCNLASLNLLRFRAPDEPTGFAVDRFRQACRVFLTAQEILVDAASYPTAKVAENAHRFRPLGLGYANLGALIQAEGLPYDLDARGRGMPRRRLHGRLGLQAFAAETSARLAAGARPVRRVRGRPRGGPPGHADLHAGYAEELAWDADGRQATRALTGRGPGRVGRGPRRGAASTATATPSAHPPGAPTGTIAYMMDCDTTGVEPATGLVTYKLLAGGGTMKIVNRNVPLALRSLGYEPYLVDQIVAHVAKHDTIEDVERNGVRSRSGLKAEHLPVFDCALPAPNGSRSIAWRGHVRMMAAVQPFLSGAISKTVNMPADSTARDIRDAYMEGWRLGLKSLAIYRDGSKGSQPLSTSRPGSADPCVPADPAAPPPAAARAEPSSRPGSPPPPRPAATCRATRRSLTAPLRDRRPRRLRHGRVLPGRPARRGVHQDGQGGVHGRRDGRRDRHGRLHRPPVGDPARGVLPEVRQPAVHPGRPDPQPRRGLRHVHRGLRVPVARY